VKKPTRKTSEKTSLAELSNRSQQKIMRLEQARRNLSQKTPVGKHMQEIWVGTEAQASSPSYEALEIKS